MKTTIDLPDDLVRKLKLRALRDRRKFKDLAADLLRRGLVASSKSAAPREKGPIILNDKKTGLPVIQCRRTPHPHPTPEQIVDILADQEIAWAQNPSGLDD